MLMILKLLQSLFRTLHSEGTPGQVAAGIALGAALGLTPLVSPHNLIIVALVCVLNVSFGGAILGWMLFVPLGFLLDPAFDRLGVKLLLGTPALTPLWTSWYNAPAVPFTNFNNTVVLGSLVGWLLLTPLIFALSYVGVTRYRATVGEKVRQSRFYKAVRGSRIYNIYTWFRPQ